MRVGLNRRLDPAQDIEVRLLPTGEQFYLEDGSGDGETKCTAPWDGTLAAGDSVVVNPGDEFIIRFNKASVSAGKRLCTFTTGMRTSPETVGCR